ncbi:hypothetical protein Tco_1047066 [Tanacetum coccineum]
MCKILVQSKGITSNGCEKNPQTQTMLVVIWTEKAPQLKLNMLLLLGVVQVSYERKVNSVTMISITRWDYILKGDIELHFIPTEYQLADIFTKPLDEPTFTRLKAELGMLNID